jgi:serpin B
LQVVQTGRTEEVAMADLAGGNRAFAAALHQRLVAGDAGNLFYSPYSISTALGMTYAGARGDTETQMAAALRFPASAEAIAPLFGALQRNIGAAENEGVEMLVANSLWPAQQYSFRDDYLTLIEQEFASAIYPVDYNLAPEVTKRINDWVAVQTRDKIQNLIPAGALNALTRMVLVNAVYFNGKWDRPFAPEATIEQPFFVSESETKPIPMMYQELRAGYLETAEAQVLELPYKDYTMGMTVVLPSQGSSLAELESALTPEQIAGWLQLPRQEVKVYLPKFTMTSQFNLAQIMKTMGMLDAFDGGKADFSGMTEAIQDLFISEIIHKAFVDVSEEGTEAAAATAVMMRATSIRLEPVPVFRADRPFLFFITEKSTGSILFAGRLVEPQS